MEPRLSGDTVPRLLLLRSLAALGVCAALVAAGGVIGLLGIANPRREVQAEGCPGGQLVGVPHGAVDEAGSPLSAPAAAS